MEKWLRVYIWIIGAALIAVYSMTAVAETLPQGVSGIEGAVVVSPIRPGPIRQNDDEPHEAPVRYTRFVVKAGDVKVTTFTTDGDGRFQVALRPGPYLVVPERTTPSIGRWRFEVTVVANQVTKVTWTADSGMR